MRILCVFECVLQSTHTLYCTIYGYEQAVIHFAPLTYIHSHFTNIYFHSHINLFSFLHSHIYTFALMFILFHLYVYLYFVSYMHTVSPFMHILNVILNGYIDCTRAKCIWEWNVWMCKLKYRNKIIIKRKIKVCGSII